MERYKYFIDIHDYRDYLSSLKLRRIGSGSEGVAFLTIDGKVLKTFNNNFKPRVKEEEKDDIIMSQDYNVSSYLFPEQLLILNGLIVGYICEYFPGNVIKFSAPYNGRIEDIDVDNLIGSYHKMVKDTEMISQENILIYDIGFNLLFNNYDLVAIDTFNYYKDNLSTLDDNLEALDDALLHELHFHDIKFKPDYDKSVEYNLKRAIRRD